MYFECKTCEIPPRAGEARDDGKSALVTEVSMMYVKLHAVYGVWIVQK